MKQRPLLWVATAFLSGIVAAYGGLLPGFTPPIVLAAAGLTLSFVRRRYALAGLCCVVAAAAALHWNALHLGPAGDPLSRLASTLPENARYSMEGTVRQADIVLAGDEYTQLIVDVRHVSILRPTIDEVIKGGLLVRWSEPATGVVPGDRVRLRGALELDLSRINPDTPSYEDYLRRHDVHCAVRLRGAESIEVIDAAPRLNPFAGAARFRTHLAERLRAAVPSEVLPFVMTVWLGDRRRIDNTEYEHYLNSGTAHVLAISGVHTSIVFASIMAGMRLLFGQRRTRFQCLVTMIAVFAFALMAGARVPSIRAATMIGLYLAAEMAKREPDAPTALSIAALVFVVPNPVILFDTGFQLSFLSVASILLYAEPIETLLSKVPFLLRRGIGASLSVQILSLPVALAAFGVFPLTAPLLNLLVVPLLGIVLWLAFATSLLSLAHLPVDLLFGYALLLPVGVIEWLTSTTAGVDLFRANLHAPTAASLVAYGVFAVCLYAVLTAKARTSLRAAGMVISVAAVIVLWSPFSSPAEVVFLDVGHGDATFVRSPGGTTMLVDAGDRSEFVNAGQREVDPFLRANYVSRLDYLVLTHDDRDHLGGVPYILAHFAVGEVIVNAHETDSPLRREVLRTCETAGVPVRVVRAGDAIEMKGATVDILHPPTGWSGSDNDSSLVLGVEWPGMSVLLTGDIEAQGERIVSDSGVRSEVLKVPHHGSMTSSSRLLLVSVMPRVAVASTGRRPGGTVFREEVARRYAEEGIELYRTDHDGGVRMRADNGRVVVETARAMRGYVQR